MSDIPERIMARPMMGVLPQGSTHKSGPWSLDDPFMNAKPYIPEALAQAMVAAAYEDAVQKASLGRIRGITASIEDIRSSTPSDARAALDAMLAKAREDALREAAEVVNRNLGKPAHHAHGAILALIGRTAEGEA